MFLVYGSMGLFGKSEPSKLEKEKRLLRELEEDVTKAKKERDQLKHESGRLVSEVERRIEADQKEKQVLKVLRDETSKRLELAEKKESQLREMEKTLSDGKRILDRESSRLKEIQSEKEKTQTELSSAVKMLSQAKSEAGRIVAEAERRIELSKKEEQALNNLRAEANKNLTLSKKKDDQLRELERTLAERERTLTKENARLQILKANENKIRQDLASVEHALDEKQSALGDRHKTVMNLTREVSSLAQRRAELQKVESLLEQASLKERDMSDKVSRMERRVADGERILSKQKADSERYEEKAKTMQTAVEQIAPMKRKIDSEIANRQKQILLAERELADMENAVRSVIVAKEQAQKKGTFITQRERQLAEMELRVDQKMRELERKKAEAEGAEKARQELTALLEEKRHILNELRTSIAQNNKTLQDAHEREKAARKAEHDMAVSHRDSDKKLKVLETTEKNLINREAAFVEHDKALREASRMLEMQKKEFQGEVNSRKAEFLLIQQEWNKKFESLGQEKRELRGEKTDVRKLVQSDVLALKDKEDELVQTIGMFERDKRKLEDEEKSLINRVRELEQAKMMFERVKSVVESKEKRIADGERVVSKSMKFIDVEKKKLEQDRDIVYRSKELKKMLPTMEKRYEELQRSIKKLEARAMDVGTRPSASKLFKEREKLLGEREQGIHLETRRLMENEREVEALESRKERAFSEYLREEVERVKQGKPGREIVNPEVHAMLDDAREKVMQGSLDNAVRLVAEAEYLVDKMQNASEKRMLMYDIKDLKASIKLATLT
jgi:chromosome segregation ATPase